MNGTGGLTWNVDQDSKTLMFGTGMDLDGGIGLLDLNLWNWMVGLLWVEMDGWNWKF